MPKIERIDSPTSLSLDETTAVPEPQTISFELARGKGTAVFRIPTATDLTRVEASIGRLGPGLSEAQSISFCRSLARACCIQWGTAQEMPEPERIRSQDDESALLAFTQQLQGDGTEPAEYMQILEGESSRNDGFDACEIRLCNGDVLTFDEPTQLDNQKREKGRTSTDGTIQFAAALIRSWNGQSIKWSDAQLKLQALPLGDFFRVSIGLSSFRA